MKTTKHTFSNQIKHVQKTKIHFGEPRLEGHTENHELEFINLHPKPKKKPPKSNTPSSINRKGEKYILGFHSNPPSCKVKILTREEETFHMCIYGRAKV